MASLRGLGLFLLGLLCCASPGRAGPSPAPTMRTFVIIFRQSPREFTAADLARRQAEVSVWAVAANRAGHKLEPRILAPESAPASGGVGAGAWPLTALLFLEAETLEAAARVAAEHPATRYGASVEVRPWHPPAPR